MERSINRFSIGLSSTLPDLSFFGKTKFHRTAFNLTVPTMNTATIPHSTSGTMIRNRFEAETTQREIVPGMSRKEPGALNEVPLEFRHCPGVIKKKRSRQKEGRGKLPTRSG
jgi:hypothetical protein